MVLLWGISRKVEGLSHHNVFFSEDYQREFAQLFAEKTAPSDPTVYVSIPSKTDSSLDTHDGESWFVLVNMPYLNEGQNWAELTRQTREAVLDKLEKNGFTVRNAIEFEQVFTPQDFERTYGANKGSIYGLSSNTMNSAFRRPANRSRDIDGLFFAGGSSHPGGGVPLVMLSAKIATDLAADYISGNRK